MWRTGPDAVFVLLLIIQAGWAVDHGRPQVFQRRIGPFRRPESRTSDYYRGSGSSRRGGGAHQLHYEPQNVGAESFDDSLTRASQQLSKRKLLLPVISEGYASTNFQGGPSKNEDKETTTNAPTTTTKRTTTATTTTRPPIIETLTSKEVPESLPQEVIDAYVNTEATFQPHRRPVEPLVTTTTKPPSGTGSILPPPPLPPLGLPSYGVPLVGSASPALPVRHSNTHVVPVKIVPDLDDPSPVSPGSSSIRKLIDDNTGLPIELYTGELITADNNPNGEELVHFSFSSPKQQVGLVPKATRGHTTNYQPTDISQQIYQPGYQQINVPENGQFQDFREAAEQFNPEQVHEDRPNIQGRHSSVDPHYPLGKPPSVPEQNLSHSPRVPPPQKHLRIPSPSNRREDQGSGLLDFLIPSFVRPKPKKTDQRRRRPGRRPPPPPPSPHRVRQRFPLPGTLGALNNPIALRLPEGFLPPVPVPPFMRPKRARLEDETSPYVSAESLGIPQIVARLGEEFIEESSEPDGQELDDLSAEPTQQLRSTIKDEEKPTVIIGNGSSYTRKQSPFLGQTPPVPPSVPHMLPSPLTSLPEMLYEYRNKLKDPEFHQNLTKAHVFHSDIPDYDYYDTTEEEAAGTRPREPVSYIQDSNPFNFRYQIATAPVQEVTQAPKPQEIPAQTTPALHEFAPPARPVRQKSHQTKPDVEIVYNPVPVTSETTTTSTESSASKESQQDILDNDDPVVREHLSSLIKHYLSSTTPNGSTPNIYVTENSIVMKYEGEEEQNTAIPLEIIELDTLIAPEMPEKEEEEDGKVHPHDDGPLNPDDHDDVYPTGTDLEYNQDDQTDIEKESFTPFEPSLKEADPKFQVVQSEEDLEQSDLGLQPYPGFDFLQPQSEKDFLEHLLQSSNLILPQYGSDYSGTPLEKIFVPSASTDDSGWHILDNNGRRVIDLNKEQDVNEINEEGEAQIEDDKTIQDDTDAEDVTEVADEAELEAGGFFPINKPEDA